MPDDIDSLNIPEGQEALPVSGVARWVPAVVVLSAIAGFLSLAWYAYHAGKQSINDEGLVVIEADKTPMKEKPVDPGGMKFPNQDKTIFETFANNPQPPKVERILPAPEEPMPKQLDTSDTTTWVNKDAPEGTAAAPAAAAPQPEEVIAAKKPEAAAPEPSAGEAAPVKKEPVPAKKEESIASYTLDKSLSSPSDAKAVTPPPDKEAKTVAVSEPAPAKPAKAAATSSAKIQLGAYRSEKEAREAWGKMVKKYSSLNGKTPVIVKADLGAKGVFFRLRASGFSSAAEAKSICSSLSAKGQACLLPKD